MTLFIITTVFNVAFTLLLHNIGGRRAVITVYTFLALLFSVQWILGKQYFGYLCEVCLALYFLGLMIQCLRQNMMQGEK
jgi:hypothetical protein